MISKNSQQWILFILSIIILSITDYFKLYFFCAVAIVAILLINKFLIEKNCDFNFIKMIEKYSIILFIASLVLFFIFKVYVKSNRIYSSIFMGIALTIISFRAGDKIKNLIN